MNSQDVINYVLNSPHNTNPAVLRTMLSTIDNGQDYVQVQSDWNQNDSIANDYIKNRPFYAESRWKVAHEEREITFNLMDRNIWRGIYYAQPHLLDDISKGKYADGTIFKIIIGNNEYTGTFKYGTGDYCYIGNGALMTAAEPNTGEAFCIWDYGVDRFDIITNKLTGTCKVSIFAYVEEVHELDVKYLPNEAQPDWNQNDPTAKNYIKNRPFYRKENWECANEKQTVQFTYDGVNDVWDGIFKSTDYFFDHHWNDYDQVTCKLVVDGVEYIGAMKYSTELNTLYIGNESLANYSSHMSGNDNLQDTGEEFFAVRCCASDFSIVLKNAAPSCEVSVYVSTSREIKGIPSEYLLNAAKSDWNQNDPTAPDYIKNRPFYDYIDFTVLVEANTKESNLLPYFNFIFDKEYIIEFDGVRYPPLRLTQQWDFNDGGYFIGFNVASNTAYGKPYKADSSIPFLLANYSFQDNFSGEISLNLRLYEPDDKNYHIIKIMEEKPEIKTLDAKYLPNHTPYVIDSEAYTYGDDALAAILEGRQVLVKVPNKDGRTIYSNFMPVLQYQLPNENNNYLTLFYLKDGIAENILAAMQGAIQGDPSGFANLYGTIEMMLSQSYAECPLKVSPIK